MEAVTARVDALRAALLGDAVPASVELVQVRPEWTGSWTQARAEIDAILFEAFLKHRRSLLIRRVLLYDPPTSVDDEPPGAPAARAAAHAAWTSGLLGDRALLGAGRGGAPGACSGYLLRYYILDREERAPAFSDWLTFGGSETFDSIWEAPEMLRNFGLPEPVGVPEEDRDPASFIWAPAAEPRRWLP